MPLSSASCVMMASIDAIITPVRTYMAFNDAFTIFPVLETNRLILNKLTEADAEAYHAQQTSALLIPGRPAWQYGFETVSVDNARRSFGFANAAWAKKNKIKWGIRLKANDGALVGQCELFDISHQSKAEIGFWLGQNFQNQGLMTECVQAAVKYSFETMGLHRIFASTATDNTASIKMLRKAGFVQEGLLRQDAWRDESWTDSAIMSILKSDLV